MDAQEFAEAWSFGLGDLPSVFAEFSDGLKHVARAIYNAQLSYHLNRDVAIARTVASLDARGIRNGDTVAFQHEEES